MRVSVAVDRFLRQKRLESDFAALSLDSYGRVLRRLADEDPEVTMAEFDGRAGTERLREFIERCYGHTSSTTRATRTSYLRSFFAWAEDEGLVDDDPARRLKRPPKRRPDVVRPTVREVKAIMEAATLRELPALLLMVGVGLRPSEVVGVRWSDVDLGEGLLRVLGKGQKWQWLPLDPIVWEALCELRARLAPAATDYVFAVEVERWRTPSERVRTVLDPSQRRTAKTAWRMVVRVADRAGVRHLGPHALRRAFADGQIRDMRQVFGVADVYGLKFLMRHEDVRTTEGYVSEQRIDDAAGLLHNLRADGVSQSHPLALSHVRRPANPVVEAAGIEPASADAPTERLQA